MLESQLASLPYTRLGGLSGLDLSWRCRRNHREKGARKLRRARSINGCRPDLNCELERQRTDASLCLFFSSETLRRKSKGAVSYSMLQHSDIRSHVAASTSGSVKRLHQLLATVRNTSLPFPRWRHNSHCQRREAQNI